MGGFGGGGGGAKTVKRPPQPLAPPQCANYWASPTRKQHHTEHRPQRLSESADPTHGASAREVHKCCFCPSGVAAADSKWRWWSCCCLRRKGLQDPRRAVFGFAWDPEGKQCGAG